MHSHTRTQIHLCVLVPLAQLLVAELGHGLGDDGANDKVDGSAKGKEAAGDGCSLAKANLGVGQHVAHHGGGRTQGGRAADLQGAGVDRVGYGHGQS